MGRMLGKEAEEKCMSRLRREAGIRKEIGEGRLAGVGMNPKDGAQKGTGWRAAVAAKGPQHLGAEVWYTRRVVTAQEVEVGGRPLSPAPQRLPWYLTAGLQIMQRGFRGSPQSTLWYWSGTGRG